jgi:hypothetical protein
MTTTTIEKMLGKAEELEQQAAALRLAASVMNGHAHTVKQATLPATLAGAVKLRRAQKNGSSQGEPTQAERKAQREALLREQLTQGPQRLAELHSHLDAQGIHISRDRVRQILTEMPDAVSKGRTYRARWQLVPVVEPRRPKSPKAKTHYARTQTLKPAREEKARQVVAIVREAGVPLSVKELGAAAREHGITSLTGIVAYVKKGWLKRTTRQGVARYSFLEMPPEAGGPPAS